MKVATIRTAHADVLQMYDRKDTEETSRRAKDETLKGERRGVQKDLC